MTRPVPAGVAEADGVRVSGAVASAQHSAATPPLPQRRVDGLDNCFSLVRAARSDLVGVTGCSRKWAGREEGGRMAVVVADLRDFDIPELWEWNRGPLTRLREIAVERNTS